MKNKIKVVAVTGGPKAGKTTFLQLAKERIPGLIVAPEATTIVLQENIHFLPKMNELSRDEKLEFHKMVLEKQKLLEKEVLEQAERKKSKIVMCDRGIADTLAYLDEVRLHFMNIENIELSLIYNRYDLVLHFESVVITRPELFDNENNKCRYETKEGAIYREKTLQEIWKDHPNRHFLSGHKGLEYSCEKAFKIMKDFI